MPKTFGAFESGKLIARTRMSTILKGKHKTLGYPVAIKVLDPVLASDQVYIDRFRREAATHTALTDNPRIVSLHEHGQIDDSY
jgi:serine/threonine-protein kinase